MRCALYAAVAFASISLCAKEAFGADKMVSGDCLQGECFKEYITSLTRESSGLATVKTRVERYCTPGYQCDFNLSFDKNGYLVHKPLPKNSTYKIQCKNPGGYVEYQNGQRVPEPESDPPHSSRAVKQLWTSICSSPVASIVPAQAQSQTDKAPAQTATDGSLPLKDGKYVRVGVADCANAPTVDSDIIYKGIPVRRPEGTDCRMTVIRRQQNVYEVSQNCVSVADGKRFNIPASTYNIINKTEFLSNGSDRMRWCEAVAQNNTAPAQASPKAPVQPAAPDTRPLADQAVGVCYDDLLSKTLVDEKHIIIEKFSLGSFTLAGRFFYLVINKEKLKKEYEPQPIGEADRLNGLEWVGEVKITPTLWQTNTTGTWQWQDQTKAIMREGYSCYLRKIKGRWEHSQPPLWLMNKLSKPTHPVPAGWQP